MAQTQEMKFACPSCRKEFTWKPEIAGKKAKCKCGTVIDIPAAPPPPPLPPPDVDPFDNPDYMYDFAEEPKGTAGGAVGAPPPPPPPELQTCPNCGGNVPPGGVVCLACGFNVQTGKKNKTKVVGGGKGKGAEASSGGGSMNFGETWKGWLAVAGGVFVICLAPYDYARLSAMERDPDNEWVYLNRRTRRVYNLFGKWGVIGSDLVAGSVCALAGLSEALGKGKKKEA